MKAVVIMHDAYKLAKHQKTIMDNTYKEWSIYHIPREYTISMDKQKAIIQSFVESGLDHIVFAFWSLPGMVREATRFEPKILVKIFISIGSRKWTLI